MATLQSVHLMDEADRSQWRAAFVLCVLDSWIRNSCSGSVEGMWTPDRRSDRNKSRLVGKPEAMAGSDLLGNYFRIARQV